MSPSQSLGGTSRVGRVLGPCLDRIVKNAAWRKHSSLVASCKSLLDRLDSIVDSPVDPASPLVGLSPDDADAALRALILALEAGSPKVAEPALDAVYSLLSQSLLRGEIEDSSTSGDSAVITVQLVSSIYACGGFGDDALELSVLRVLLSAVRSSVFVLRGECLVQIVKSCYNVYLGSQSAINQVCAKAVLFQILMIVYARVEVDDIEVEVNKVLVADVLDLTDKSLNDSNIVQEAQNFINEASGGARLSHLTIKHGNVVSRDLMTGTILLG
ncbi:hypothetical protein HPP92_021585 [Vanilla planifolia]|uniref:Mon2/Sec7/BIG1-like dimerisation and cyclophilin-binding domain-containing protein n=1 Tax=Vanilla planifolia TaxID=51239 RepID=A0A835Q4X0_VANPL|nr:hypothetical protein HPP92_021585 [Vanilla planifolia]